MQYVVAYSCKTFYNELNIILILEHTIVLQFVLKSFDPIQRSRWLWVYTHTDDKNIKTPGDVINYLQVSFPVNTM